MKSKTINQPIFTFKKRSKNYYSIRMSNFSALSIIFLLTLIFNNTSLIAQTGDWDVSGTGTTATVTPKDVAIGTLVPDGRTEIFVTCPAKNGLVVTKDENCPLPYVNVPSGLNAETVNPISGSTEPSNLFVIPFSYNVGSTLPMLFSGGSFSAPIANNPLIWVRTKDVNSTGASYSSTRFVVLPDGKTGINVYNPRATLDVRNMSSAYNLPSAIFGVNENSTISGSTNNKVFKTRHIQIIPKVDENGYNQISKTDDLGIFFTDGKGLEGANSYSGLIIAPWAANRSSAIGGIRMDSLGNVQIHGSTRATKVNVNVKWWSDFVFEPQYKSMSLTDLELFIKTNKHLPNIPSEKEVLENGIDIADVQAKQLQKIEELTLYIIDQQKQIDQQKSILELQQKLLVELVKKIELVIPNK